MVYRLEVGEFTVIIVPLVMRAGRACRRKAQIKLSQVIFSSVVFFYFLDTGSNSPSGQVLVHGAPRALYTSLIYEVLYISSSSGTLYGNSACDAHLGVRSCNSNSLQMLCFQYYHIFQCFQSHGGYFELSYSCLCF